MDGDVPVGGNPPAGGLPGDEGPPDSPAARWRWLLGVVLILLAMGVVPGVVYRLTAPDPVPVTVAPSPTGAGDSFDSVLRDLGPALDARSSLAFVPWNPSGADTTVLILELEPDPQAASATVVTARLYRTPGRVQVWAQRVEASHPDSLAARVAGAVAAAVVGGG